MELGCAPSYMVMLFAVHAMDAPDARRQEYYDAHKAHLRRARDYGVKLTIGGPLMAENGKTAVGSLMVFEAADRSCVQRFNDDDPFRRGGVWRTVLIAQFDRKT